MVNAITWKCRIRTPLGEMLAIADHDALCELRFSGQRHAPEDTAEYCEVTDHPILLKVREQLAAYFTGQPTSFDLPLNPGGTPFQQVVWNLLLTIPRGETTTYGALAQKVGNKRNGLIPAAQAIGGAVGRNPIAIVIPCHRVIGADGSLTGYAGGIDRKIALLKLEGR